MTKILGILLIAALVLSPWLVSQASKTELFDLKKSQQELEVMKGILRPIRVGPSSAFRVPSAWRFDPRRTSQYACGRNACAALILARLNGPQPGGHGEHQSTCNQKSHRQKSQRRAEC